MTVFMKYMTAQSLLSFALGVVVAVVSLGFALTTQAVSLESDTTADVWLCKMDANKNYLEGWTVTLSGDEDYEGVTGEGCAYFADVPFGTYTVGEVMQYGWTNITGLGEVTVDSPEEEFDILNGYPDYSITGSKWHDKDADGYWDEGEYGLAGWTITATDAYGNEFTAVTDEEGYYEIPVYAGDWEVTEEMQDGWIQSYPPEGDSCTLYIGSLSKMPSSSCNFGNYQELTCSLSISDHGVREGDTVTVTWGTTGAESASLSPTPGSVDPEGGSVDVVITETTTFTLTAYGVEPIMYDARTIMDEGPSGPSVTCTDTVTVGSPTHGSKGSSSGGSASGQVLGATTTAAPSCSPLLSTYMRMGMENDVAEVTELQTFLTGQGFETPVTGIFDLATDQSVRAFQTKYADEVLKPWVDLGIAPDLTPTGYVFKTTRWKINNLSCPGSEAYPTLP